MTDFALIENNIVTNIAVVPQDQSHRGADYMADDLGLGGLWIEAGEAGIGWLYENGELVPPAEPESEEPEPTEEEKARAEQERINNEARAYLTQTDWYVTRHQETGQPIPEGVLTLRQEAREKVIDLPPLEGSDDED